MERRAHRRPAETPPAALTREISEALRRLERELAYIDRETSRLRVDLHALCETREELLGQMRRLIRGDPATETDPPAHHPV